MKYRLGQLLCLVGIALFTHSCQNASQSTAGNDSAAAAPAPSIPLSADSATRVDDFSFIEGCIQNNKAQTDVTKAYAHCKCIMAQIKLKYGNTDDLTISKLQQDTSELRRIMGVCK